jgi:superoxide dismutase, Fe-Mn family
MSFELADLPYNTNALEPYLSKKTIEYHYSKHLHGYVANLNKLIQGTNYKNLDLETIIKVADGPVFNNASQVWNHIFYFECLRPAGKNSIKGPFADVIKRNFGTIAFFKNAFAKAAGSIFGAGWIWMVLDQNGSIQILPRSNAGNPLRIGFIPLMTCDLWEHAYYLDYQHRYNDYIDAFWKLINWNIVETRYNLAIRLTSNDSVSVL